MDANRENKSGKLLEGRIATEFERSFRLFHPESIRISVHQRTLAVSIGYTRSNSHCTGFPRSTVSQPKLGGEPRLGRVMQPGFSQRRPNGSVSSRGTWVWPWRTQWTPAGTRLGGICTR